MKIFLVVCGLIMVYMLISINADLQQICREIKKLSEIIEDWSDT